MALPDADRVVVLMGSGAETAEETVRYLVERGERVGVIKVRLFRPFAGEAMLEALPESARVIAALDRTKEPGSAGEPLYQDVVTAVSEAGRESRTHRHRRGATACRRRSSPRRC